FYVPGIGGIAISARCGKSMPSRRKTNYSVRKNSKVGATRFARGATRPACRIARRTACGKRRPRGSPSAGPTAHEIMAIIGHRTLEEVERYTRAAARRKLADSAMAKIRSRTEIVPPD